MVTTAGSGEDGHADGHDEDGCFHVGHRRDSCDFAQQVQTAGVNDQSAEDGKAGSDSICELSDQGRSDHHHQVDGGNEETSRYGCLTEGV